MAHSGRAASDCAREMQCPSCRCKCGSHSVTSKRTRKANRCQTACLVVIPCARSKTLTERHLPAAAITNAPACSPLPDPPVMSTRAIPYQAPQRTRQGSLGRLIAASQDALCNDIGQSGDEGAGEGLGAQRPLVELIQVPLPCQLHDGTAAAAGGHAHLRWCVGNS